MLSTDELLSSLAIAETGVLGYVLTAEPSYLKPYNASRKALAGQIDKLRRLVENDLVENDPKQRAQVETLDRLIQLKIGELSDTIHERDSAGLNAALATMLAEHSEQLMDNTAQIISEMKNGEQSTLARFSQARQARVQTGLAALVGSTLLASCCLALGQIILSRTISKRQRAEEDLHLSERRFKALCEQAPLGIYETDAQSRCVYINPRWSAISGLSVTESLGHGWAKALHPDDRAKVFEGWESAARRGASWEYRLINPLGETRWIRALGGPIYSDRGDLTGYVGTLDDVTERKLADEARREALQQLQLITDNIPVGVTRCSRDLRYLWVSRSYAAWLGLRPKDLEGRLIVDVVGQEVYKVLRPHIEKVLSGERTEYEDQVTFLAPGTRWVHAVYVPTKGQDLEVDGWITVVADVTGRHEAEERLRKSEERFRVTFFQAAVGIAQTSIDGQWLLLNDRFCEILGYSREEFREKTFIDITHPDDHEASLMANRKLLAGEISSWSSLKRYIRKDGCIVWARLFVSLVRDQHNEAQYFVSVVEDITKEIQAEQALRQSRQELRALTGRLINAQEEERKRISRELHDDLSQKLAMLAFDTGSVVLTPPPSVEDMKEPLRNLQRRLVQLSEDVRQISHRLHPSILEDLGLPAALSELCDEFSAREGIEVAFEEEVPRSLPVDVAASLYRVAQEALHNILKHARASEVRLKVIGSPEGIHLCIHDNGVGFDSEAALSQPGLGIVSMKERVRLVQGELSIHSQPGRGTQVRVFVPLSKGIA
jgi:PAS domain S-box-containing protein